MKKIKIALGKELEGTYQKRVNYSEVELEQPQTNNIKTTTVSG